MTEPLPIRLTVNGAPVRRFVEPRLSLADFLRQDLGLTGTHLGCEMGACGACLVRLDGRAVHACLTLAVQADGGTVETVEGLTEAGTLADLQAAFHARNALQCGYCTPGMLVAAQDYLAQDGAPSREAIRDALSGNYCRCTGYEAIVDAIAEVARARRAGRQA
ncbi:(2Fe-2S)-binding domain protein [Methylobacterium sp. 4-46]|uniref:(2Fe-2S)-binding protein n=1 Tax=unclassified Methylobacterium TaxID=2615210 RepID=UPI000152D690|nr:MULTISPECIES: (2Fe-2S)-binding protein [Methylobacterium]ACA15113.1 (2Fe-2S)-binding domain protein [Methylobacterium sp. 4-46]WFT80846.1 (2Fe-2S)-binding protein [Methylobacterium nodulans]